MRPRQILIVGGGHVGFYVALRLQRRLAREIRDREVVLTLIDDQPYMTYQPFLPEAAAGNLEPRHVVVPLRRVLKRVRILTGTVTEIDHREHRITMAPAGGGHREVDYDLIVVAPGSISKLLPIPGLAEEGIGFKTIGEAIALRNHVLSRLEIADSAGTSAAGTSAAGDGSPDAEAVRQRALNFVFVGAGFSGVEALAELEDMARDACRYFPTIEPHHMRWVLVEASDHILPEVGPEMGRWTLDHLRERGIEIRLETLLKTAEDGHVVLSDGTEFDTDTLVWTAGVKPHPLVAATDLPTDERGRIKATAFLTVEGIREAFTAGDSAAVPDLTKPGEFCAPNAQHAVRQARVLADNVVASVRERPLKPYRHAYAGSVASLGLHDGVAQVYGMKVRGLPAWFMHRTYHLSRVPTLNRKVRVIADWTLAVLFPRETVPLGSLHTPREEFELAARESRQKATTTP